MSRHRLLVARHAMRRWLLLWVWSTAAWAADAWQVLRSDGPLRVEARRADSGFTEFRITAVSRATPRALADAVWVFDARGTEARMLERRLVLSESPRERLVWSLVRPPIVSLRESLIRFRREDREGAVAIDFASEPGPTPESARPGVRITVRGTWRFSAAPDGKTLVEHTIVSDPGGGLAPWLVTSAQEDMALSLVKETLARAEQG